MFVRVPGDSFRSVMMFMLSAGKCTVNISVSKNRCLSVQRLGLVCIEREIPILEMDNEIEDITVDIGTYLQFLNSKEAVNISVTGDILHVKQACFEFSAVRKPEDRMETNLSDIKNKIEFSRYNFVHAVMESRNLDNVGKDNLEPLSDLVINDGYAYTSYSNTRLCVRLNLPDMAIQGETTRELVKFMKADSKGSYAFNKELQLLYLAVTEDTYAVIPVKSVNLQNKVEFTRVLSNVKDVTEINVSKYKDTLSVVCTNYKKHNVELTICNGDLRIYVDGINTKFTVGSAERGLFSIKISVSQLSAIVKAFGNDTSITVAKGDNILCLKQKSLGKQLIMSGIIY